MNVPGEENLERNSRVERPRPPVAPVTTICIFGIGFSMTSWVSIRFYISRNELLASGGGL